MTKNALANLVRGGASAVAALVLPHFLTRQLDHDRFAAWVLLLQIAAYANYLDFGIQTAVARYLAQALELGDEDRRDRLVSTALGMLSAAGALALCVLGFVVWRLPYIFHDVPMAVIADLRGGLSIMGGFAIVTLPMSAFTGVLIGLQRNEYPALAVGLSRILGAAAVLVSVRYTHSLMWLAFCLGFFNLLASGAQWLTAISLLPSLHSRFAYFRRDMARELAGYCSTLAVWSFCTLLVGGVDLTIVGYFDFSAVGYYSIASTLVSFFTGLNSSFFGAMMAPVAVLQARKEYSRIRYLIITATQINSYVSIGLTVAVFLFGRRLLVLWVGPLYASQALPILEILLVAQTIRLMANAYSTVLVATGQQRYGLFNGLLEGLLNFGLSWAGMLLIGAKGVAWATLIAAAVALCVEVLVVMPRVREISVDRRRFASRGIIQPFLALLPPMLWIAFHGWYEGHFQPSSSGLAFSLAISLLIAASLSWAGIRGALLEGRAQL